jgi:bacillithiol system protein YtxJ
MHWKNLQTEDQLDQILEESRLHPVVLFKHSTRCSISATAKSRFERQYDPSAAPDSAPYLLDLISFRSVSNKIAADFGVRHESPQVLVIKDGKAVHHASHMDIRWEDVKQVL